MKVGTIFLIAGSGLLLYYLLKKKNKSDEIILFIDGSKKNDKGNYLANNCVPNPDIITPFQAYNNTHNESYASSVAKQKVMDSVNSQSALIQDEPFFDIFFNK